MTANVKEIAMAWKQRCIYLAPKPEINLMILKLRINAA
jgi:hypothetical protein